MLISPVTCTHQNLRAPVSSVSGVGSFVVAQKIFCRGTSSARLAYGFRKQSVRVDKYDLTASISARRMALNSEISTTHLPASSSLESFDPSSETFSENH